MREVATAQKNACKKNSYVIIYQDFEYKRAGKGQRARLVAAAEALLSIYTRARGRGEVKRVLAGA